MNDNNISTITQFLEATGARLRFFDIGRRLEKIPRDRFLQFERTEIPYPYPLQQQAWFALVLENGESGSEHSIWFLRLPLDEQGKLLQAARDDFMHRLLERVGENLQAAKEGGVVEAALEDNPYSFKPKEERMATFHSRLSRLLKQPPSKYYPHAREYFAGELGWDQWSFVGYQGIADMAARLDQEDNETTLTGAIPLLPGQPFQALCHCLENEMISIELTAALLERVKAVLEENPADIGIPSAAIRGCARSRSQTLQLELVRTILESEAGNHIEILAAISGRCWELLQQEELRLLFLERLAVNNAGQDAFNQCLSDLLFVPGMREPLLASVRNPNRSERLATAIGTLFQSFQQQ
jgi:hypothetical protein